MKTEGIFVSSAGKKVFSLLIGAVAAALMTLLLIGIFAFIMLKTEMSPGVEGIGIICISVVSCFAGGFFCGRRNDTRGFCGDLLWGVCIFCFYCCSGPAAGRNCPQRRFLFLPHFCTAPAAGCWAEC